MLQAERSRMAQEEAIGSDASRFRNTSNMEQAMLNESDQPPRDILVYDMMAPEADPVVIKSMDFQ